MWMKVWGWMVANKRLQQTGCDSSLEKERLRLKAWDWGVAFQDFEVNTCDWRDRELAIEVLQLKGVETEGLGLKART